MTCRTKGTIAVALAAFVLMWTAMSCGSSDQAPAPSVTVKSPSEVAGDFFSALQRADDEALLDVVHVESPVWDMPRFQDPMQRADLWQKMADQIVERQARMEVVSERAEGDRTVVTTRFFSELPGTMDREQTIELRRDLNLWRVWLTDRVFKPYPAMDEDENGEQAEPLSSEDETPARKRDMLKVAPGGRKGPSNLMFVPPKKRGAGQ